MEMTSHDKIQRLLTQPLTRSEKEFVNRLKTLLSKNIKLWKTEVEFLNHIDSLYPETTDAP